MSKERELKIGDYVKIEPKYKNFGVSWYHENFMKILDINPRNKGLTVDYVFEDGSNTINTINIYRYNMRKFKLKRLIEDVER